MLTLRGPIELTSGKLRPSFSNSLGERISANYALASARFTPEELLFLMSAPAELELPEPSMTSITFHSHTSASQAVTLEIVNNVVNRLLMENTPHFTYQDQVYVTRVLNRLGITDCSLFLRQVQSLQQENLSVRKLLSLYSSSFPLLKALEQERQSRREALPAPSGEDAPAAPAPTYTLQDSVYNRLETLRIYQTLQRFQRNQGDFQYRLSRTELLWAEQYRVSQNLALAQYKRETAFSQRLELHHHLNQLEAGEALEPPRTEEQVLSQSAAAALVQVVDSVTAVRAQELLEGPRFWMDVTLAVRQSVGNALSRYRFYHTEPHLLTAVDARIQQELSVLYQREGDALTRLAQSFPALEHIRPGEAAELPGGAEIPAPEGAGASAEVAPAVEEVPGMRERELINQATERLLQGLPPLPQKEPAAPVELTAPAGDEDAGEPEVRLIRQSEHFRQLADRFRQEITALNRQEVWLVREGAGMVPPERLPGRESREVRELVSDSQTLREAERQTLLRTEQSAAERLREPSPGAAEEAARIPLTEAEMELAQPPSVEGGSAAEPGERLLRQLNEIDRRNRERLERLRESTASRTQEQTLLQPDKQRIFRDALQGLDSPEQVMNAFYEGAEAQAQARKPDPQIEAVLAQADEATRKIYETVLRYQSDPQATIREGLIHPASPEVLNSELASAGRREEAEPLDLIQAEDGAPSGGGEAVPRPAGQRAEQAAERVQARQPDPHVEAALAQADETTRRIYETVLRYQSDPQAAIREGLIHPVSPEALNEDLAAAARREEAEPPSLILPEAGNEVLREQVEQVVERFREYPGAQPPPVRQTRHEQTELIHRTVESAIDEELLERLSHQQTERTVREEIRTESPPSQTVVQPDVARIQQQTAVRAGEDVTELVNRTLARKMDVIAEKVYTQMERKLQLERARRGRM